MATTGEYYSRHERALRAAATGPAAGAVDAPARLAAAIPVTLNPLHGGASVPVAGRFVLMGPADVERLGPGAIARRFPSPGVSDAEETKLPHVEFTALDLPWRYTPNKPNGERLDPWLVLVVAPAGPDGLSLRPDGKVRIGVGAQGAHPLGDSWQWAHVHEVGGFRRSRILSPVPLEPNTGYTAALVPAFTPAGGPAWTGAAPVTLSCFDSWQFRTGERGDFAELAKLLVAADLAVLAQRGGRPFGRAEVEYRPRGGGAASVLPMAGALRAPSTAPVDPADAPPSPAIAADVALLLTQPPVAKPDDRDVLLPPHYSVPFTEQTGGAAPPPGGWIAQLSEDPRHRGAAGLGAWAAIAWQDRIAEAARVKLGDAALAADRIRMLALGVAASRALWRRHVPIDPVERLAALAPSLGRLPADTGQTVLGALAGHTPQLSGALLSSAARRALRPGPARSPRTAPGPRPTGVATILAEAARCPDPTVEPDVGAIRRGAQPYEDPRRAGKRAIFEATEDQELAARVADRWTEIEPVDAALLRALLTALQPGPDGRTDPDTALRILDSHEFPPLDEPGPDAWEEGPDGFAPPCRQVDLTAVGKAVAAAIDPHAAVPPAARRVFATLPGIHSMRPVEVEPELDLPLWSFLSDNAPDWMLPGVGDLAEHEVVAVETNPAFVRALLVGANNQSGGELRWRAIPLAPRSAPLRKFWQRKGGEFDARPLRNWPAAAPLASGQLAHPPLPAGTPVGEAVVVIRSPLFRRYPATVVYLYPAAAQWAAPDPHLPLLPPARIDPTFTGSIGRDVTFFGFPVPASTLRTHWVVLEEPPAGYRFTEAPQSGGGIPATDGNAATFAHRRFAPPVRVLLGELL